MFDPALAQVLRHEVEAELLDNIIPFWMTYAPDPQSGGFHGAVRNDLTVDEDAPRGVILNARIVWAFARAYRFYKEERLLHLARRGFDYLTRWFFDPVSGGVYWAVDRWGAPLDTRKRTYAQAFALYALAEYYRATGDEDALGRALALLETMLCHCRDRRYHGYFETFERDWSLALDQRLSALDMDEKKSMNTHLHVLEACAALESALPGGPARSPLRELLELFLGKIIDPLTHHFILFFDEQWAPRSDHRSFGHDIEGSWLLCESAGLLEDPELHQAVEQSCLRMARATRDEALDPDGGLIYEAGPEGIVDGDKHWWPQAEALVAFLNAFELERDPAWFDAAWKSWRFISDHIADRKNGEWFWKVSRDGVPDRHRNKADEWKCPYHNTRACIETITRLDRLAHLRHK